MKYALTIILFLSAPALMLAQAKRPIPLDLAIKNIIDTTGAKVGVAVSGLDFKEEVMVNNDHHYPMQSVFKFPLALAILHEVDKGKLSLNQTIHIPKQKLEKNTWSPMTKDFPNQDINIKLADLLRYTVSKSDNNGCDALFRLAGGTGKVLQYIKTLGINDMNILATEADMHKSWPVQYNNWCKPGAMSQLLGKFYNKTVLSENSTSFLMKLMTESENSPDRLKGLLPANAIVAHKTGSSDTNKQGLTAATNDVGIVTLPNGQHYAIVVYVSDYKGDVTKGEHIIAVISKLVWDKFTR